MRNTPVWEFTEPPLEGGNEGEGEEEEAKQLAIK